MDDQDKTIRSTSNVNAGMRQDATIGCPACGLRVGLTTQFCPQDGTPIVPDIGGALSETYEFLEPIGSGGMSIIYKARHRALDRPVAIKMLHGHLLSEESIRRFHLEAKAASSLNHPNVVSVHDFGLDHRGQPFMVMDYVEGKTLADILRELGELPLSQAVSIFIELCDALQLAHERGILHRDLKPSNIMVTVSVDKPSTAKILDFGIAKLVGSDAAHNLTQTGELFGSPLYMSPEQCASKSIDPRSDVYSLGCLMYECLTGTVPLRGATIMETISKQMSEHPVTIGQLRKDKEFPPRLEALIDKALEKNPDQRWQSMKELQEELLRVQDELDSDNWTQGGFSLRRMLRTRSFKLACAGVVVIGALTAGFTAMKLRHPRGNPTAAAAPRATNVESGFTPQQIAESHRELAHTDIKQINDAFCFKWLRFNTGLVELDLRDSAIDDLALVEPINRQKGLVMLYLDGTSVTDEGLEALQGLPNLAYLSINRCSRVGTAAYDPQKPKGIAKVQSVQLQEVRANRTGFDDSSIRAFQKLDFLHTLALGEVKNLTATGYGIASQIPTLQTLELMEKDSDQHPLNDEKLSKVQSKSLKKLRLDNAKEIKGTCLNHLAEALPELLELNLDGTSVDNAAVANIDKFAKLVTLHIRRTKITDQALEAMSRMRNLYYLGLDEDKITDAGIKHLAAVKSLHELWLCKTKIGAKALHLLSALPIERLHLDTDNLNDADLTPIAKFSYLKELTLNEDYNTGDETAKALSNCGDLEVFQSDGWTDDQGALDLAKCTKLVDLQLRHSSISEKGIQALVKLPNLETFSLTDDSKLTPKGVALLHQAKRLKRLYLRANDGEKERKKYAGIGDAEAAELGKLTNLQSLYITHTNISGKGLMKLKSLNRLTLLDVSNCEKLKKADIHALHKALPDCDIISTATD